LDKRYFLHTTVTADIKRRIKAAAAAEFVTPTAWLRRVAIRALPPQPLDLVRGEPEEGPGDRENRLYVRLGSEDSLLLKTRALARGTRPATYIGVLVRSHLRSLRPLPKDELLALRCAVAELGALTRELHRIAYVLGRDGQAASPDQPDLPAVLRLCQTLRSDTKALIRAYVNSWEIGRPLSASASRQPVGP
jgi:hypothetical protein